MQTSRGTCREKENDFVFKNKTKRNRELDSNCNWVTNETQSATSPRFAYSRGKMSGDKKPPRKLPRASAAFAIPGQERPQHQPGRARGSGLRCINRFVGRERAQHLPAICQFSPSPFPANLILFSTQRKILKII